MEYDAIIGWIVALGVGLMIGAERERRQRGAASRSPAGVRTFTVTSLLGATSLTTGGEMLLAVATVGVIVMTAIAYWRSTDDDKGLTTEMALVTTVLLGGLAMRQPQIAAAVAVVTTALLASRTQLHRLVNHVLTEDELYHALMFAAATLVVLPLVPDRAFGPFGAVNPRSVWTVVVLVIAISAAGYIAIRLLGSRWGLPIAGLASGFVSSTATIGAMATRAATNKDILAGAVAGAMLSTVATFVQMAAVLAATSLPTLQALALPLISGGAIALAYGAYFTRGAVAEASEAAVVGGEPFSLKAAILFALTLAVILLLSAALKTWFGQTGAIIAAAIGGFVDTHSAAISVAALVAAGKMSASEAVFPILAALTTNTMSKVVVARTGGDGAFAARVVPGLILAAAGAWAGAFVLAVR